MVFVDQTKLELYSEKVARLQVEETLDSLREDSITKDQELEELKVCLEALENSVNTLHKIHQDS